MIIKGRLEGYDTIPQKRGAAVLHISAEYADPDKLEELKEKPLDVSIGPHRKRRSINANALLWECLGRIAAALRADKWDVYLQMLKRYGQYTYICVIPSAVDAVRQQWRESEVLGPISINGREAVQLLCYYGSSTYDSKQFSTLLDGVISEMKEMDLETPSPDYIRRAVEAWEAMQDKGKRGTD